jgi:hypothetical protein
MPNAAQTAAARVSQLARTPRARRIGWWILGIVIAFGIVGFLVAPPVAEMEQLMLTNATATEEDLRVLANRRAQTTKDWLVGKGGIPADRVFLIAPKLAPEGIKDKGKPERVDFSLK